MSRPAVRWGELVNLHGSLRESRQHLKLAAKCLDDFLQRRNLHVGLFLQFRQAGLFDAEGFRHLMLALAGQLPDFAQQQLGQQFLSADSRLRPRPFSWSSV